MRESLRLFMSRLPCHTDGAIITSDLNRFYFTGLQSSAGVLLVNRHAAALIIDFRYIEKARQVLADTGIQVIEQDGSFHDRVVSFFEEQQVTRVLVETDTMTVDEFADMQKKFPELSFGDSREVSELIRSLREQKLPEELECIKKAQQITDAAFSQVCNLIKPGMTERELELELYLAVRQHGGTGMAFDTIAVSGMNSSMPHGVPTDKPIAVGDFVTMDFGAVYQGYCSDMTRTVAIGEISDEQHRVYETVLNAQLLALQAIHPGASCRAVDAVAREYIDKAGYPGCFGHSLGHAVGLFIHESPSFSPKSEQVLKEGMVMTVEPGIYIAGKFGVRIEDMVYITENGMENITKSEKNLITL